MNKNTIKLQTSCGMNLQIQLTDGRSKHAFLWIGNREIGSFVPDRSVKKLKRFCEEILKKRKAKS